MKIITGGDDMNGKAVSKPIKRSRMRLFLGKSYYSMKRYFFGVSAD